MRTESNVLSNANNVLQTTAKLYAVEDIAKELNMSVSFVHAHVAKEKPQVMAKEGRRNFYSQAWVDSLKSKPLHKRNYGKRARKVTMPQIPKTLAGILGKVNDDLSVMARVQALESGIQRLHKILGIE